jgi:hypothetical protein
MNTGTNSTPIYRKAVKVTQKESGISQWKFISDLFHVSYTLKYVSFGGQTVSKYINSQMSIHPSHPAFPKYCVMERTVNKRKSFSWRVNHRSTVNFAVTYLGSNLSQLLHQFFTPWESHWECHNSEYITIYFMVTMATVSKHVLKITKNACGSENLRHSNHGMNKKMSLKLQSRFFCMGKLLF